MKLLDALRTRNGARIIAGAGVFSLTLLVMGMLFVKPSLGDSDLFKMLAQAVIIQGYIGMMAWLFTNSPRNQDEGQGQ